MESSLKKHSSVGQTHLIGNGDDVGQYDVNHCNIDYDVMCSPEDERWFLHSQVIVLRLPEYRRTTRFRNWKLLADDSLAVVSVIQITCFHLHKISSSVKVAPFCLGLSTQLWSLNFACISQLDKEKFAFISIELRESNLTRNRDLSLVPVA